MRPWGKAPLGGPRGGWAQGGGGQACGKVALDYVASLERGPRQTSDLHALRNITAAET